MPNRFLITGITGTLGTKITEKLLERDPEARIIGISRDEQKQMAFPIKDSRVRLKMADVRDYHSLRSALPSQRFDVIFHLAALKCQPQLEDNPGEAIATNIKGTNNVLILAGATGAKVCFTSSDKAVYPINIYGHTKAAGEKLVSHHSGRNTICRYGNVIGSRGSFFPQLVKSLKEEKKAYLTHPEMTRFWLTIDQVADFVIGSALHNHGLCIPKMESSYVVQFIGKTAEALGIKDYETIRTGMRPGEKLHEHITTRYESGTNDITSEDSLMTDRALTQMVEAALGYL